MTTVRVTKSFERIISVECEGHSGYAEYGEDIVCAGISSIVQTALLGLMQVAGVAVDYEADSDRGYLRMTLPEEISPLQDNASQIILSTMMLGIMDLHEGYSDFIELEVI